MSLPLEGERIEVIQGGMAKGCRWTAAANGKTPDFQVDIQLNT